jgi:hypothetical protein
MTAISSVSRSRDHDEPIATPALPASRLPASGATLSGKVQCRVCGQWLREVGSRHLRRAHRMTLAEYRRVVDATRAAEADGFLPDGTPFFGRLGEMASDPDEGKVQCHLCGEWFKWVGGLHLKYRHPDWTIAEYRRSFGLSRSQVTMAANSREILRAITVDRLRAGEIGSALGGGMAFSTRPGVRLSIGARTSRASCAPRATGT